MSKTKAKAKVKTLPPTKHKAGCPALNGQAVELGPDHNRKMMTCRICGVPDTSPQVAKNAYKVLEEIAKIQKSIPKKVAKPKAATPTAKPEAVSSQPVTP